MAEMSFLCVHANCQRPACVFGFAKGANKQTVCEEHLSTLTHQGIPTFEIEAYHYVESTGDYSEYQRRREIVQTGLRNIAALESRCEADLHEIQRLSGSTSERNQALCTQAQKCSEAMKQRLKVTISRLQELIKEKNFELSAEDNAISELLDVGPLLQLMKGWESEDSLSYLEVTEQGALVEPDQAELARLRAEVVVKRPGQEKESWIAAKQILSQFASAITQFDMQIVVQGYVSQAIKEREAGNYVKALRKLLRGRTLLQQWGGGNALLCMHMGQVRAYFGEWDKAETELKQGLQLQLRTDPTSELALQLSNSLMELYHQRNMMFETIEQGEWTLYTFEGSGYACELLRAVFFVANACYELKEIYEGYALVKKWTERLKANSDLSKCILLCIQANLLRSKHHSQAASRLYEEARELVKLFPPFSYFSALTRCSFRYVDDIYKTTAALTVAFQTFLTHFPQSNIAFCLFSSMGDEIKGFTEREAHYKQLVQLYSAKFENSLGLAVCLSNLASFYYMYSINKAEECFVRADALFSAHFPLALEYADFLQSYGGFKYENEMQEQAKECYLKCYHISLTNFPQCWDLIQCMHEMKMGNPEEAEELYLKAQQVYSNRLVHFPLFLQDFGDFYYGRKQYQAALTKYLQAHQIYSEHLAESGRWNSTVEQIAKAYKKLKRAEKGEEYYMEQLAAQDFNSLNYADSLNSIAGWYAKNDRKEAEECYLRAGQVYLASGENLKYAANVWSLADWCANKDRVEAEEYYLQAIQIYLASEEHWQSAHCLGKLAYWCAKKGKMEAEEYYLQACQVYSKPSFIYAWHLESLAQWYMEHGRKEAEYYYLQACHCYDSNDPFFAQRGRNSLASWFTINGRKEASEVVVISNCRQQCLRFGLEDLRTLYK